MCWKIGLGVADASWAYAEQKPGPLALACLVERSSSKKKTTAAHTAGKTKLIYTGNSLSAKTI